MTVDFEPWVNLTGWEEKGKSSGCDRVGDGEDLFWFWSDDSCESDFEFLITSALGVLLDFEGGRAELEACTEGILLAAMFWAVLKVESSLYELCIGPMSMKAVLMFLFEVTGLKRDILGDKESSCPSISDHMPSLTKSSFWLRNLNFRLWVPSRLSSDTSEIYWKGALLSIHQYIKNMSSGDILSLTADPILLVL